MTIEAMELVELVSATLIYSIIMMMSRDLCNYTFIVLLIELECVTGI